MSRLERLSARLGCPCTFKTLSFTFYNYYNLFFKFCQEVFSNYFDFFKNVSRKRSSHSLLTLFIITDNRRKYNRHFAQNYRKIFVQFADQISLDKIVEPWYNGKFRFSRAKTGGHCQLAKCTKKRAEFLRPLGLTTSEHSTRFCTSCHRQRKSFLSLGWSLPNHSHRTLSRHLPRT